MIKWGGGRSGRGIGRGARATITNENYVPHPPSLTAAAALSDLEPGMPFRFGFQEAIATKVGYKKIALSVFTQGYLLFLLGSSSLSLFASDGTNKYMAYMGAV